MPKRSPRKPPTSQPPADPRIQSQIHELVKYRSDGQGIVLWEDERAEYGSLKRSGTSLSEQEHHRKATAFATKCTDAELSDLTSRCRDAGFVLRVAHI
jgi:hypothetical protein